jgi:hypothetical protein
MGDMDYHLNACWYDDEFMMIPACVTNEILGYRLKDIGIVDVTDEVKDTWSSFERGRVCDWATAVSLLKTNKYQRVPSTPDVILSYAGDIDVPKEGQHNRKTFRTEIGETEYLVQATSNETHGFWQRFALQAKSMCATSRELTTPGYKRYDWEQGVGMCEQIGTLDERPVMISIFWNKIDGHAIGFWEMTSQVCDYKMAEEWLNKTFKDVPRTNSSNFFHALRIVDK